MTNPLAEGKTKVILCDETDPNVVRIVSKDDITAGDGAQRSSFVDKGYHSALTNSNVFELLKACGVPVAYISYGGKGAGFMAARCDMLPYEVVVRRVALGSYLKRNPGTTRRARLETLVVEFFLKTTGRRFGSVELWCDDPLISEYGEGGVLVQKPSEPRRPGNAIHLSAQHVFGEQARHPFKEMEAIARKVFLVLEKAWDVQRCVLCDLKIEFGTNAVGMLVVADVITNDEWRLLDAKGEHLDKQRFRDGTSLDEVAGLYRQVAERTVRFGELLEKPRIILWRASHSDHPRGFYRELSRLGEPAELIELTKSVHKAPEESLRMLREALRSRRDVVIIAYVGRSNGAGPVLQADTHVPVIAVPATWKECQEDVWSSLRMPSDVPLVTVLDPGNAIQAALGVLSLRNVHAYLARRMVIENAKLNEANSPSFSKPF